MIHDQQRDAFDLGGREESKNRLARPCDPSRMKSQRLSATFPLLSST